MTAIPLVIDLDGTLTRTDMLHESAVRVLCDRPLEALAIPYWLWQGKAVLKKNLAQRACFDAGSLPYDHLFLDWLTTQRAQGRQLVLCTASDTAIATKIAGHLGLFDEVMASDGLLNLAGAHKAQALVQRFGRGGFDYAGNSHADLAVWQCARHAIVVNASDKLTRQAAACCHVEQVFAPPTVTPALWSRMLRVHQWLKNLLLFVPLVAAHQITQPQHWLTFILAFVAFSICASSVYIANDLFDLESDRQHPRKCKRPFASGLLPIWLGVLLAPLLLMLGICLAAYVGKLFLFWLGFYFVLTCAYSWLLKRLMLLDCLTLAMLYTLRVIAGAAAADMPLSFWLLAFSVFLFLSLAFVKRYAELQIHTGIKKKLHGRGYYSSDAPIVQMMGIASGYASTLVLALYLNSKEVALLYHTPEIVWGAVPVVVFWISWMWMQAHRGNMHDDPVIFAIKDKASLLAGLFFALILLAGTRSWSW